MQAYENYNEAELGYTKSKIEYFEELADSEFKDLAGNMGINCSCAYADKELVGWITFAVHNEEAHIRLICASPDQHGKGIGKALITSIIDSFPEIKTITVASNNLNKKAHAFYKKLGFTQTPFPAEHYNPEHYTGFEKNLN
jgi:ribosomal protein S18 acetylase RimI-like enzyme